MLRYYHYRQLSVPARSAYKAMIGAIRRFDSCAVIDSVNNLQVVVDAIKNDNPHLFYVDWHTVLYSSRFEGRKTVVYFTYLLNRRQTRDYLAKAKAIAPTLRGANELTTVRRVHDYLAAGVRYNRRVTEYNEYRRNDHNLLGPLFEGMGVCEGIARAAQFLLRELRVECTYQWGYVTGEGVNGYHAWNLLCLDGELKKMDVTWDLAKNGHISHRYFCTPL